MACYLFGAYPDSISWLGKVYNRQYHHFKPEGEQFHRTARDWSLRGSFPEDLGACCTVSVHFPWWETLSLVAEPCLTNADYQWLPVIANPKSLILNFRWFFSSQIIGSQSLPSPWPVPSPPSQRLSASEKTTLLKGTKSQCFQRSGKCPHRWYLSRQGDQHQQLLLDYWTATGQHWHVVFRSKMERWCGCSSMQSTFPDFCQFGSMPCSAIYEVVTNQSVKPGWQKSSSAIWWHPWIF